jgi:hypothetical protein
LLELPSVFNKDAFGQFHRCTYCGLNIGDEYLDGHPKLGPWRDTHIRLAGPCVDASDTGPCLEKQGQEVPAIGRTIDLTFDLAAYPDFCPDGCPNDNTCSDTPSPPTTCPCDCEQRPADWGAAVVGGTYVESVTGLHRIPIQASGVFELRRVSDTAELNPQP